jgi:hypothetical protein
VTSWIGLALSTRAIRLGVCNAAQISFLRCTFSQKSAVLPNTLASIKAVSTVTDRLLLGNHKSLNYKIVCDKKNLMFDDK